MNVAIVGATGYGGIQAVNLLKKKVVAAVISAGNTGCLLSSSFINLKIELNNLALKSSLFDSKNYSNDFYEMLLNIK